MRSELALEIYLGDERLQKVALTSSEISLGRDVNNSVVLSDPRVSNRHARLAIRDGQITLSDAGSAHGTFLKGRRIQASPLTPGDEFQVGPYALKVVLGQQDAVPLEPHFRGIQSLPAQCARSRPASGIAGKESASGGKRKPLPAGIPATWCRV